MAITPLQRGEKWIKEDGTPTDRFAEVIERVIQEIETMTANAKLFSIRPDSTDAVAVYTAPQSNQGSRGTSITKFSATDPNGSATYSVYIGTVADATTKIINAEVAPADGVAPNTLIDQLIMPGDSIWVEPSAADTIVFYGSGIDRR